MIKKPTNNIFYHTIVFLTIIIIAFIFFFQSVYSIEEEELTHIMGYETIVTKEQMYTYLMMNNTTGLSEEDGKKFIEYTIRESINEGVRADIAFCLMIHETGYLNFGGDVTRDQNNFGGLGTTGGGVKGASFDTMEEGVRAVVQHLKCYASDEDLNLELIDPRWDEALREQAVFVEYLGYEDNPNKKGWAYPGDGYGERILAHMEKASNIKAENVIINVDDEKLVLIAKEGTPLIKNLPSFVINILFIALLLFIILKLSLPKNKKKKYLHKNKYNNFNKYKRKRKKRF